jgi:Sulfotransferase family
MAGKAKATEPKTSLRERVARRAKIVDKELFLELNREPERAAIILGSGRGGTTWIAEQIARHAGSRMLFEPFHPRWNPVEDRVPLFLDPADSDPRVREAVARVLSGRVRKRQVDQVLAARLPRSRVVKDIHTTNLAPWFRAQFPEVPVVYVVRHPIASSLSRLKAGRFYGVSAYMEEKHDGRLRAEESPAAEWLPLYDEYRAHDDPLVRQVAEWCLENAYPLSQIEDAGVALAYYENIVLDGTRELGRLSAFCQPALGHRSEREIDDEEMRRPSAMDWYGTAAAVTGAAEWKAKLARWTQEVDADLARECMGLVAEFGIELDYDESPLPVARELHSR